MSSVGDRVVWVASKLWFVWFVLHCELFVSCLSIVAVSLLIVPTSCCVFCMTWHRMRLEHAVARSSEQWWMISTLHWYQELHSWTCFCTFCCTDYMSFPCTNCSRYSTWSFLSLMPCRPTCIITPDCFQSSRMTLASSLACCASRLLLVHQRILLCYMPFWCRLSLLKYLRLSTKPCWGNPRPDSIFC